MDPYWLTPERLADLDALEFAMARFRGPLGAADLGAWSSDALNGLRCFLSTRDLDGPAIVDGEAGTVDGLVERVVAVLGEKLGTPTMRVHAPHAWDEDERRRIAAAMDPHGEMAFYMDGEAEPMESGLLYDRFEGWIFDEEW